MSAARPRVALVVQRYGAEVNGGAEALARRVAGLLSASCEVTVLTTCALDYRTWADHYPPGEDRVDGVRVLRFPVPEPRDPEAFDRLAPRAYAAPGDLGLGERWMRAQGPVAPGLLQHLGDGAAYDAVVFVTYLYATTAMAIGRVADRAILAPTLHDEPPAALRIFDAVFDAARLLMFSTEEEAAFAAERFGVGPDRARVVGAGLDAPPPSDPARGRALAGGARYALYVGRMDGSKGVPALVEAHAAYRRARPDGLDLVLVGGGELDLPDHPWLHRAGFVAEEVKHDALAGADVVVVPSPYESLSFTLLEAWSHGRPTLATAASPVLVGQSRRASGGLWYDGPHEYAVMLDLLARSRPLASAIGRQGRAWVAAGCSWDRVRRAWEDAVAEVAGSPPGRG